MDKVSRQADRPDVIVPMADVTKRYCVALDSQQAGHLPNGLTLSHSLPAQQTFPALVQDLEMAQFSSHDLFNPYFEEFVMDAEPPEFWR